MHASLGHFLDQLPGLEQMAKAFVELGTNGMLLRSAVASLFRVTVGFYLAVIVAIPAGLILGRRPCVYRFLNPIIQFLRPISPLAWIPFAILWFGIGEKSAVFIIFFASFFPILIPTIKAAAGIHPMYFQVAANLQLSTWESVRLVVFPATMPTILIALRVALGVSWLVVVAAEMIAVKSGLGYLIIDARNALRMDYVIVSMTTIGGIGLFLDFAMTRLEHLESVRWKLEQK